jgi:hypothetical protein
MDGGRSAFGIFGARLRGVARPFGARPQRRREILGRLMLAAVVVASEVAIRMDGAWSTMLERTASYGLRQTDGRPSGPTPERGE